MPVLTINTNINVEQKGQTLRELSQLCANILGKPESYVMIHMNDQQELLFAGSTDAAASCSLASLGLSDSHTEAYSKAICAYLEDRLGIPAARTYIEFKSPERSMFGWNNSTF